MVFYLELKTLGFNLFKLKLKWNKNDMTSTSIMQKEAAKSSVAHTTCRISLLDSLRRSVSEELLDEDNHLWFLDGSWSVLVEGGEDLIECLIREFISGSEVSEGILNELLGLFFVEGTALIDIVGIPDLVDDSLNGLFFSWHWFWKCLVNN